MMMTSHTEIVEKELKYIYVNRACEIRDYNSIPEMASKGRMIADSVLVHTPK